MSRRGWMRWRKRERCNAKRNRYGEPVSRKDVKTQSLQYPSIFLSHRFLIVFGAILLDLAFVVVIVGQSIEYLRYIDLRIHCGDFIGTVSHQMPARDDPYSKAGTGYAGFAANNASASFYIRMN